MRNNTGIKSSLWWSPRPKACSCSAAPEGFSASGFTALWQNVLPSNPLYSHNTSVMTFNSIRLIVELFYLSNRFQFLKNKRCILIVFVSLMPFMYFTHRQFSVDVSGTECMPRKAQKQWRILRSGILLTIRRARVLSGAMFLLHTGWGERRRNNERKQE